MRSYNYDSYRGRNKGRTFLMVLAVLLTVVLVALVAFFLVAQRYIVYTDDGQARLELPFLQKATPTPAPAVSQDVVIITPDPTPTPTPTPDPAIKAVWLLRGALTDGTAQAQVKAAGGTAVMFNMKADDGTLGYISSLPQAVTYGASDAKPGLNESIRELTGGELYTIARVSCFKDNKAPRGDNSLAIKTNSGYNWQDPEGVRWMNVIVPAAREYVINVCKELAELGFDELLLENSGYPTQGHLEYIKKGEAYDPAALTVPVETFYTELAAAMKDYPNVKLSFSAGAPVLTGEGDRSGQTPALLGAYAGDIYVPQPEAEGDYDAGLASLKEGGSFHGRLVYLLPAGETTAARKGSSLVKPWETPPPALTPPPSQPSAEPESAPAPAEEAVSPTPAPELTPTPLSIP